MSRGPIPDKPRVRPSVREVQRLIDAYYQFPNCGVGGALHVVLDDDNWGDGNIQDCIDSADEHWSTEPECAKLLGRILLLTTRTQRAKLGAGYDGEPMTREAFIIAANSLLAKEIRP